MNQHFVLLFILAFGVLVCRSVHARKQSSGHIKGVTLSCQCCDCPEPLTEKNANQSLYPRSCLDYLKNGERNCGVYAIYDNDGNSFPVYCDMKTEPGSAWTLVMSWSNAHRALAAFRKHPLNFNAPVNENSPNWKLYRQTLTHMLSLKGHSTQWRATCSYPTHGVDYTDYVRGNFKDFDIVDYLGSGVCKKVELVNIRGHLGIHLTARFWQVANAHMLHINSESSGCQFVPTSGAVSSEDNFGYHHSINPKFRCTTSPQATTQWWFGGHL